MGFGKYDAVIAQYYCEIALVSYNMRKYRASTIAWASMCLGLDVTQKQRILSSNLWNECPLITPDDIKKCGIELYKIIKSSNIKSNAVYKKFCQPQYMQIAMHYT